MQPGDTLLTVDVQNDFCPGGALAVPDGDAVVPVLNTWIGTAERDGIPVYVSRDWHPVNHVSFEKQNGEWPPHCLQDSRGAAFHPDLKISEHTIKITKGVRLDQDQNSAFDRTGLAQHLKQKGINRLWVGGLALDVCVLATVLDGLAEGFDVFVIEDGVKPVIAKEGIAAIEKMWSEGAKIVTI